ncbi:MAG: hypothetical protein A2V79_01625 [Betaproteobacteria bacterium RBG_16_56_24]|nr:MAG: hypothetical protein A2V79_01625 [Betaproteobacteria bacterium RBG_16_56_24]
MQNKHLRITSLIVAMGLVGAMGGCATQGVKSGAATSAVATEEKAVAEQQLFMTFHENGRVYVLGDTKLQEIFMQTDEVALTRTRIGDGPDGRTLIFGMNKDDAKAGGPTAAEMMYDGKLAPAGPFYGEVFKDGRYYVFVEWKDMADYLKHGEVPLTFTEIGTGPKGETVIYALNKETAKQGKPAAAIERFHKQHPATAR